MDVTPDLSTTAWVLLVVAALLVGFSKLAISGVGVLAVVLCAQVMPVQEATAAALLILLVGDGLAVMTYRRDPDWRLLRRVLPAVLPGLALGAVLLAVLPEIVLRRGIGAILLVLLLLQARPPKPRGPGSWTSAVAAGTAAGTTTMIANAGGPVMVLYLALQGVDKRRFLGTAAYFFAVVNVCKVPFLAGLGLIDAAMLLTTVLLVPAVVIGALVGYLVVGRLSELTFRVAVVVAGAGGAGVMLLT